MLPMIQMRQTPARRLRVLAEAASRCSILSPRRCTTLTSPFSSFSFLFYVCSFAPYSCRARRSYGRTQILRRTQRPAARLHLAYTRDSDSKKLEIFIPLFVFPLLFFSITFFVQRVYLVEDTSVAFPHFRHSK